MRLKSLALCASLLAAAACDGKTNDPVLPSPGPRLLAAAAPQWSLYSSQTPTEFLDAAPGWEVGTRFTSSKPGKIIGFRFYRAPGETGTNYGRLWTNSGKQLKQSRPFPSGEGWVTIMLDNYVDILANTTYRVSVNTNSRQAKTGGGYAFNGALGSGPLYSDGGYYGQPVGYWPYNSSASYFFVDVIFEEYPSYPDLYIQNIDPFSGTSVTITVCNGGAAATDATRTRYFHSRSVPNTYPVTQTFLDLVTPAMAPGECKPLTVSDSSATGYLHDFQATADIDSYVTESNESNNWLKRTWQR